MILIVDVCVYICIDIMAYNIHTYEFACVSRIVCMSSTPYTSTVMNDGCT
jgi:hypothetical protein